MLSTRKPDSPGAMPMYRMTRRSNLAPRSESSDALSMQATVSAVCGRPAFRICSSYNLCNWSARFRSGFARNCCNDARRYLLCNNILSSPERIPELLHRFSTSAALSSLPTRMQASKTGSISSVSPGTPYEFVLLDGRSGPGSGMVIGDDGSKGTSKP